MKTSCKKYLLVVLVLSSHAELFSQINRTPVRSPDSVISRLSHLGFLSGSVLITGTDTPLSGVRLSLNTNQFVAHTDKRGEFTFGAMPPGWYHMTAYLPRYHSLSQSVLIQKQTQSSLALTLTPDYSMPGLHTTGGLELFLFDANTGMPKDLAQINLVELGRLGTADSKGIYCTYNLPPGKYHIKLSSRWDSVNALDSVELSAGKLAVHFIAVLDSSDIRNHKCSLPHRRLRPSSSLSLDNLGSLSGVLRDSISHETIGDASIFLAPYADETYTDSTGHFDVPNLVPGRYCLTIRMIGYRRKTFHDILVKPKERVFLDLSLFAPVFIMD